ncbi:Receptor-like protein EIX2, partial [Cucurbita argyrosperma subsp. sororia]
MAPSKDEWPSDGEDKWVQFYDVDSLTVQGDGRFNGQGSSWWNKDCHNHCNRPTALFFHNCNGLRLSKMKHINSGKNHISINDCNNVVISNIHISAPDESPNTDGINISQSKNVLIENSFIATGDDCIAINNGSSNINIVDITCGPGHGISGSGNPSEVLCIESEREALLRFKKGLVDPLNRLSSWDVKQDCCKWVGISCDNSTGYVKELKLANNEFLEAYQLKGKVSDSILNLKYITHLDLSNNDFGGVRIPSFLGSMVSLRYLDLSYSSFGGLIPHELGNLSNLNHLDLGGHLTDQIAKLRNLSVIDLSINSITGPIPESIGNLSSLTTLNINYNELSGTLPKSMRFLSSLHELRVSDNHLEGAVSEDHFANLANLEILEMNDNNFTLNFATEWIPPFNLYMIRLRSCIVGPQFPKWLKSQKKLSWVDLSNAKLSDTIPDWFWSWSSQCIYLNLSHNQLYGTLPHILFTGNISIMDLRSNLFHGSLPRLVSSPAQLDLSNNFFSGNITNFLCRSQFLGISVLHLGNNFLSGNIPNCWENWESLQVLSLDNNNLSGMIPTSMGSLTILVSLHLRNNSLSGVIPRALQSCLELRALDLSLNAFHGKIPAWIGTSLLELMTLNLRSNELSGLIPKELCDLSDLQIMDISNNNLSGSIPHCFGNFTSMATKRDLSQRFHFIFNKGYAMALLENAYVRTKGSELYYDTILALMTSIDLSNNNLSGEIPEEISNLFALRSLNLSINHLRGTIPDRIGGMKDLESLDLSRNQLWGRIPPSMSELSFLSYLNLSYNNLSGPIPTGTQLQRFTPFSFIGNEVCGDPLKKRCGKEGVTPEIGNENGKESEGGSIIDEWFYLSLGMGFVFGFWGIWGPLLLSKAWRVKYFRYLASVCHKLA